MRLFGSAGAVGLFLGVAFGAFAAHLFQGRVSADALGLFETGMRYQMYHSVALLIVAFLADKGKFFKYAGQFYIIGILLFSESLYTFAMTNISALGVITPFGGLSFLVGHLFLLLGFLEGKAKSGL